jgi:hypothetical protein
LRILDKVRLQMNPFAGRVIHELRSLLDPVLSRTLMVFFVR